MLPRSRVKPTTYDLQVRAEESRAVGALVKGCCGTVKITWIGLLVCVSCLEVSADEPVLIGPWSSSRQQNYWEEVLPKELTFTLRGW